MAKPHRLQTAIVKQEKSTSLVSEETKRKAAVITGYIEKFALIDGRRDVDGGLYNLYVDAICGYRPELSERQIEKGLRKYLESGERFPWPGTLIEMMEEEV